MSRNSFIKKREAAQKAPQEEAQDAYSTTGLCSQFKMFLEVHCFMSML